MSFSLKLVRHPETAIINRSWGWCEIVADLGPDIYYLRIRCPGDEDEEYLVPGKRKLKWTIRKKKLVSGPPRTTSLEFELLDWKKEILARVVSSDINVVYWNKKDVNCSQVYC